MGAHFQNSARYSRYCGYSGLHKKFLANATLSERSSCQQFEQADTITQDEVLQDMIASHHSYDSV
jgi:hypothetical protein